MSTVLVTGAGGMIGRSILQCLSLEGFELRAQCRSKNSVLDLIESGASASKIDWRFLDFAGLSSSAAAELCRGCSLVIHLAGVVHQSKAGNDLYEAINVEATRTLARAAEKEGCRQFVFFSSSSVYGNRATDMLDENAPLVADTGYAASKISAENLLKEAPPAESVIVLRPSLVYGPFDRGNMLSLIRQVASGKYFIVGGGTACKSLIYTGDLCRALLALVKSPESGFSVYNLANPEPLSVKELSLSILNALGRTPQLLSLPEPLVKGLSMAAGALLADKSPLSQERLNKLTRNNTISAELFFKTYNVQIQPDLLAGLREEIGWAKGAGLLS